MKKQQIKTTIKKTQTKKLVVKKTVHKKPIKHAKQMSILQEPKTYISVNKKTYRAITPEKALIIAKKLTNGVGKYKVHVIYGKEQISKRKIENIENTGKFNTAHEARQAIVAFLDPSLWITKI